MNVLRIALVAVCLACTACAERPIFGVELGTKTVSDCVPGSVSRPCN